MQHFSFQSFISYVLLCVMWFYNQFYAAFTSCLVLTPSIFYILCKTRKAPSPQTWLTLKGRRCKVFPAEEPSHTSFFFFLTAYFFIWSAVHMMRVLAVVQLTSIPAAADGTAFTGGCLFICQHLYWTHMEAPSHTHTHPPPEACSHWRVKPSVALCRCCKCALRLSPQG